MDEQDAKRMDEKSERDKLDHNSSPLKTKKPLTN